MSDFSDFLERLIQEDGYSVYGFAQEAGVDRPTLHRVLKGQLVPSAPFFQKVVKTLRLFPQERERLLENYNILKNGESFFIKEPISKSGWSDLTIWRQVFLQFLLAGISPGRRSCCGAAFPASGESIWWKTLPVKFF